MIGFLINAEILEFEVQTYKKTGYRLNHKLYKSSPLAWLYSLS